MISVQDPYLQKAWDSWHPVLLKTGSLNVDELYLFERKLCLLKKKFIPSLNSKISIQSSILNVLPNSEEKYGKQKKI